LIKTNSQKTPTKNSQNLTSHISKEDEGLKIRVFRPSETIAEEIPKETIITTKSRKNSLFAFSKVSFIPIQFKNGKYH